MRAWYPFLSRATLLLHSCLNRFFSAFNTGLTDADWQTGLLLSRCAAEPSNSKTWGIGTFKLLIFSCCPYSYIIVMLFSWTLTNGTKSLWSSQTVVQEANWNTFLNLYMSSPVSFIFRQEMPKEGVPKYCHKIHVYCLFLLYQKTGWLSMGLTLLPTLLRYFQCWNVGIVQGQGYINSWEFVFYN